MNKNRKSKTYAWPAIVAGLFAVLCSATHAQSFPKHPLQTGAGDVPPNIMFILDDSGSMNFVAMPRDVVDIHDFPNNYGVSTTLQDNPRDRSYLNNTIYYDPRVHYQSWMQANGTRMSGGTAVSSVYTHWNYANGNDFWIGTNRRAGTRDLRGSEEGVFYVPLTGVTNSTNSNDFIRYRVHNVNGQNLPHNAQVVRDVVTEQSWTQTIAGRSWGTYRSISVPSGTTQVVITTSGGSRNSDVDLYASRAGNPTTDSYGYRSISNTNNESITIDNPTAGSLNIGVYNYSSSSASNVLLTVRVSGHVAETPSGRSQADELTNIATWYSYHRTRMKLAKAGASEAFSQLTDNVRVGYRTIHRRSDYDIPIGVDEAASTFSAGRKTTWFNRVFDASGGGGTPLHSALDSAGNYFRGTGNDGPYGPAVNGTQLACRQNFSILTTDGFWNSRDTSNDSRTPDGTRYSSGVPGDQDGEDGARIIDHSLPSTDQNYNVVRYSPADPFRDGRTGRGAETENTLADVAMKYWKMDLRPDMDNLVPTSTNNPAFWQHMVTFGISIGLKGTLDQASVAEVLRDGRPRRNGVPVNWPNPMSNSGSERIDDLLHAAVNGRGEFIAATSAVEFRDALNSVLGQIQARLASGSNVATNSTSFQSDTRMYQATYMSKLWSGDLVARDVTRAGGISNTESWRVSQRINSDVNFANRTVLTWNGAAGVPFPTSAQQSALDRDYPALPGQPPRVTGADNAAYIMGSRRLELSNGGGLRNRSNRLGDIINSSPAYVRSTESIFVGANDGMLHGINALTGDVRFSYVPAGLNFRSLDGSGNINGGLTLLSDPAYTHEFFVDGPVALSGSLISGSTNYLVATLGRGGKGAFALDVTSPSAMTNSSVLWDHTAASDNDMGYVLGLPLIVRGNDGSNLAIVPNGIDSINGDAVLYVYNIATGAQLAKIAVGETGGNGLSSPRAADLDGNGTVDYVYAGDMRGNVWKFDLNSSNASDWNVAQIEGLRQPLFTATDSGGNRQPITGGVAIARNPDTGDIWVTFGTGKLIVQSDLGAANSGVQSLYGVADRSVRVRRADLTLRTIPAVGTDVQGRSIRAFERFALLPSTSSGWVINMGRPTAGERVISGARINGRAVFISSVIPIPGSGCEEFGGGYLNVLDAFTGTSARTSGDGDSSFFDLDGDGSGADETIVGEDGQTYYIGSIDLGIGMPTESGQIENMVLVCGTGGVCAEENLMPQDGGPGQPRRISWRELVNDD